MARAVSESPNVYFPTESRETTSKRLGEDIEMDSVTDKLPNLKKSDAVEVTEHIQQKERSQSLREQTRNNYCETRKNSRVQKEQNNDCPSLNQALASSEAAKWKEAIANELNSLEENNTWELIPSEKNQEKISCKLVLKKKRDESGNLVKYKARLVAMGCKQKYGINYMNTFAPVARHSSILVCLAWAIFNKMKIHHIDFSTAYLNATLDETIIISIPKAIEQHFPQYIGNNLKLNKAIYGLKQAGRNWNKLLESS